jgi:hypothetical protein
MSDCTAVLCAPHCSPTQFITLGGEIGETLLPMVQCIVRRLDPQARIDLDAQHFLLRVGTWVPADDVVNLLLQAGVAIRSWAAEVDDTCRANGGLN